MTEVVKPIAINVGNPNSPLMPLGGSDEEDEVGSCAWHNQRTQKLNSLITINEHSGCTSRFRRVSDVIKEGEVMLVEHIAELE